MLDADGLGLGRNGFFNGDNMHADTGSAGRDELGHGVEGLRGHRVEEIAHLGMLGNGRHPHVEELGRAGNEQRQNVLLMTVLVFPVVFDKTDGGHLLKLRLELFNVPAGGLGDLLEGHGYALGLHAQSDTDHVVVKHLSKSPVFRLVLGDRLEAELIGNAVGHLFAELKEVFFVGNHVRVSLS